MDFNSIEFNLTARFCFWPRLSICLRFLCLIAIGVLGLLSAVAGEILSDFSQSDEGWRVIDLLDTFGSGPYTNIDRGPFTPVYLGSGGRSGGGIQWTDTPGDSFFFQAPAKFLGDLRSSYGLALSFDLRASVAPPGDWYQEADVILTGRNGMVLVTSIPTVPSVNWLTFFVQLKETEWRAGSLFSRSPSKDELMAVLADVKSLWIRGEAYYGTDGVILDNVRLGQGALLQSVPAGVATNGLVAYYPLNGDVRDSGGSGNDGVIAGSALDFGTNRFSALQAAANFSGQTAVTLPTLTTFGPSASNAVTVSFWCRIVDHGVLLSKSVVSNSAQSDFTISLNNNPNQLVVSGNGTNSISAAMPQDSPWAHLCVVLAPNQDAAKIFINGSLVRTGTVTFNQKVSTNLLQMGNVNGFGGNPFVGELDDVALYNRALTPTEVQGLFAVKSLPVIVNQPTNVAVFAGSPATFGVILVDNQGVTYQWLKGGAAISGATNASLIRTNIQASDAGNYSVRISNVAGSVTSSEFTVSVVSRVVDNYNANATGWRPQSTGWSAVVVTPGVYAYRGDLAGDAISVKTNLALTPSWRVDVDLVFRKYYADSNGRGVASLALFPGNDSGVWFLATLNKLASGQVQADVAWWEPAISTWHSVLNSGYLSSSGTNYHLQITRQSAASKVKFTVLSTNGFYYSQDSATIPTNVLNSLTASGLRANYAQIDFSSFAVTTPFVPSPAPVILSQPVPLFEPPGLRAVFSVSASGVPPLTYQWRKDGVNLSSGTASNYVINLVQPANQGNYSVVVSSSDASVTSSNALLTVGNPPNIVTPPQGQSVVIGGTAALKVDAGGPAPLTFQWIHDGQAVFGATNASLTISNFSPGDAGIYSVLIQNPFGLLTTPEVTLSVAGNGAIAAVAFNSVHVRQGDGLLELSLVGQPAHEYLVQSSVDLISWTDLGKFTNNANGEFKVIDQQPPSSRSRFYRAKE